MEGETDMTITIVYLRNFSQKTKRENKCAHNKNVISLILFVLVSDFDDVLASLARNTDHSYLL